MHKLDIHLENELVDNNVDISIKNKGFHIILKKLGVVVDFFPTKNKFIPRGTGKKHLGGSETIVNFFKDIKK